GRRAERLDPRLGDGAGLVVVTGDTVRFSTLPATPAGDWVAAAAAGVRDIDGEPWRLRSLGRLGSDTAWAVVRIADAAVERRAATRALVGIGAVARADLGMVYRVEQSSGRLTLVAHHGIPARYLEFSRSRDIAHTRVGDVARTGEYTLVDLDPARIKEPTLREAVASEGYRTQLVLPIPVQGATWGVMALVSRERRRVDAD